MNLTGKTALVFGVADESSIAWSIARGLLEHGAKVHIGYQQKFYSRVRLLLQKYPAVDGARCDVLNDSELDAFFARFKDTPIDVLVHCIAFGPPEVFTQPPSEIKDEAFLQTVSISTHSFLKLAGRAKPYLREWASIFTLTYQASEQASPFYGMMGVAKAALESSVRYLAIEMGQRNIRVNAISPGPIETPAALGEMLAFLRNPHAVETPAGAVLKAALERINRNPSLRSEDDQVKARALWHAVQQRVAGECAIQQVVTQGDVTGCAVFLASDYSRKITGQVLRIDCGMSSSRLMPAMEPDVANAAVETSIPDAAAGKMSSKPGPESNPVAAESHGILAVKRYLQGEFPDAEVSGVTTNVEGRTEFTIVTAGGKLHIQVDGDLLSNPTNQVIARLRAWGASSVLREAGGLVVRATSRGLSLAEHRVKGV